SAWALAYAEMAHGRELHDLLTKFKSTAARSSLHNAMLAEHGPQRWLEIVDQHELEVTASDVTSLASAGEDQIASQLAEILLRRSTSAKSASTAPSFNEAVLLTTTGAADRGQQSLEEAWEDSIDRTAAIADAMAGSAMRSGDNVLEVQARQRSLEIRPTPRRRAELALAHLRAGDTQQALLVLSDDAEATEELVAIGRAQLALGDR
ncbi:MAG: hypothetical protein GWN58_67380, partial [Anaerolineae bacterium]|nr:hypothetical protein [Anaerolineae bacterium]